ncbi:MAG: KR domain-containing protein, partial [Verrucomicrobiota bacterium]
MLDEDGVLLCRGTGGPNPECPVRLELEAMKRSLTECPLPEEATSRVELGGLYRGARAAWASEVEALVSLDGSDEQFRFHPAAFSAILLARGLLDAREGLELPFSVREVSRWDGAGRPAYVHVTGAEACVIDEQGNVSVRYRGLTTKAVSLETAEDLLFVPGWSPVDASGGNRSAEAILVYSEKLRPEAEMLVSQSEARKIVALPLTDGFAEPLASQRFDHIYVLAAGIADAIALVRALKEAPLHWTFLVQRAFAFDEDERPNPDAAALVGWVSALAQENSRWHIDLFDQAEEFRLPVEAPGRPGLRVIVERDGRQYARSLERCPAPLPGQSRLRENGIYVLVGGAGRLGRHLTHYLIRRYQARVIWFGRREPDAEISGHLDALEGLEYISVPSAVDLRLAFERVKQDHGTIHGVFNLVMVPQSAPVAELTEEAFRAGSFGAKVESTTAIYDALKDASLDFLATFSSMQSFAQGLDFMSRNMSSYVAGCMFQDAFIQGMDVSYPVRTINWGYWSQ